MLRILVGKDIIFSIVGHVPQKGFFNLLKYMQEIL